MSISTEISRLQTARNTIRTKMVELGMATNTDTIDRLATVLSYMENKGALSLQAIASSLGRMLAREKNAD